MITEKCCICGSDLSINSKRQFVCKNYPDKERPHFKLEFRKSTDKYLRLILRKNYSTISYVDLIFDLVHTTKKFHLSFCSNVGGIKHKAYETMDIFSKEKIDSFIENLIFQ